MNIMSGGKKTPEQIVYPTGPVNNVSTFIQINNEFLLFIVD